MKVEALKQELVKPAGKVRYWILLVLFLAFMVAYIDRANVAVLVADKIFTDALGITGNKASMGLLMTIFLLFYGLTNFIAGPIIQRFGSRRVLGWAMLIWAVLMLVMGSMKSFLLFIACRAVLGITEAATGPVSSKLIQTWFPVQERAKANSVWYIGILLAQVVAMPLIAGLVSAVGWQGSFYALFVVGIVPVIACFILVYDKVSQNTRVSKDEADYISAGTAENVDPISSSSVSFQFLKSSNFWLIIAANTMMTGCNWGVVAWLPTFLQSTFNFSWAAMGGWSALPYAAGAVAILIFSPIMDRLNSRAAFTTICAFGLGASLYIAAIATNSAVAILAICLATSFSSVATISVYTMIQNLCKGNEVATATGFLTAFGYTFGSFFPYLMGAMYNATGTFTTAFYLLTSLGIVATIAAVPLWKRHL